jgi:ribonuclease HII
MLQADAQFPGYAFAQHKGYPTAQHLSCLRALGPCAIHRRSFAPVRQVCHVFPQPVTPPPALTRQQHP